MSEAAIDGTARGAAALFGRALRYVAPFRGRFAVKFGLALASLFPALLVPWPLKVQIDHVIEGRPIAGALAEYPFFVAPLVERLVDASPAAILVWTVLVQIALVFAMGAFGSQVSERDETDDRLAQGRDTATRSENQANYGHSQASGLLGIFEFRWTLRLTQDLNHAVRSRLFERLQRLPMTTFDDERIGDAMYRVMVDTTGITAAVYELLLRPAVAALGIVLVALTLEYSFGAMGGIGWLALGFLPLAFLASLPATGAIRAQAAGSRRAGGEAATAIEEGMRNILAVQSLGADERERGRFTRDSWQSFGAYRRFLRAYLLAVFAVVVPAVGLGFFAVWRITDAVIAGQLTTGDFAVLLAYFAQVATHAVRIGTVWMVVQDAGAGLGRVFQIFDAPEEGDPPGAAPLPPVRAGVRLEDVHVAYPDGTRALRGVSLDVPVGRITALVGPAGAGKTTLAYLIPAFLRPDAGRVLADGVDLAGVTLASLRSQIAFVFQETVLFDGSVEENLRMGDPSAGAERVAAAAQLAGADEFVRALPDGYATRVGRGGSKLSVGQRQRIAIARALVRDAPILVLDEPTSALDPHTERQLVASLREASRERAVLVIAHRLSTVRAADEICFLDQGRIAERGSHEELMARPGGAYRRFVDLQLRGSEAD